MKGRTAVVIGGGRGIGAAVARSLTKEGLLVSVFARTAAELSLVVKEHGAALSVQGDVRSPDDLRRLRTEHERELGPPDVVVYCAGILVRGKVEEISPSAFREVLEVNLVGAFSCAREFLPGMKARGRGRILHISSISGTLGTPLASPYNASKWGLIGLTKCLAEELRGTGVTCLSVSPGSTDTEMLKQTPFPALMTPWEVARVVLFAALEAPDAMTGANLEVFG